MTPLGAFIEKIDAAPRKRRVYCVGDSWFQYPIQPVSVVRQLQRVYRDTALFLNDSKAGGEAEVVFQRIKPKLRDYLKDLRLDAVLLSLGGNDIIGEELVTLLKSPAEIQPSLPGIDDPVSSDFPSDVWDYIKLVEFERALRGLRDFYLDVVLTRDGARPGCTIVAHTYATVFPSGRKYTLGPLKVGPWIKPYFKRVGLADPVRVRAVVRWLLEGFQGMLDDLAANHDKVLVVHSLDALDDPAMWDNEIHPTGAGFEALVAEFWRPVVDPVLGTLR